MEAVAEQTTFRPRNGISAECYWRIRVWCEENGFSLSDVLNAIMPPVAYYLENHCQIDAVKSKADVIMNFGKVEILHVHNGKCYPLATTNQKDAISLDTMRNKVEEWKQRNIERPTQYDLLLHAKD